MKLRVSRIAAAVLVAIAATTAFAQASPDPGPAPPGASAPVASPPSEDALPADVFYRLLVGDIALQRDEPLLAARAYFEAARATGNVALARRATEIALATRQRPAIEQAAKLWQELEPKAERPGQILAAVASGNVARLQDESPESELRARLERFLADAAVSGAGVGEPFLQINRVFGQQSDKVAVFRLVVELAKPYPGSAEAQFAIALAALNTGLSDADIAKAAIAAADRALAIKPDWDRAVLLKAELLGRTSARQAIGYLEAALKKAPQSRPLRIALAQHLVEQKRYAEARELYRSVLAADPSQRELQFGTAVLSVQMKDWDAAETDLQDLKRAGFGDAGQVEFYLAQVVRGARRSRPGNRPLSRSAGRRARLAREAAHRDGDGQAGQARRGEALPCRPAGGDDRAARAGAADRGADLPRRERQCRGAGDPRAGPGGNPGLDGPGLRPSDGAGEARPDRRRREGAAPAGRNEAGGRPRAERTGLHARRPHAAGSRRAFA